MADDEVTEFPPVVCGGVYERPIAGGGVEQMLCISMTTRSGERWGLFRRVGFSDERFQEGTADLIGWTLIWGPGVKVSPRTGKLFGSTINR